MSEEKRPEVVIPQMCQRHQRELFRKLKLGGQDTWRASLILCQILLFGWVQTDRRVYLRTAGNIEDMTAVLAEIGCLACFDRDGFSRAARMMKEDEHHAAQVSMGKEEDPHWPIKDRIAALPVME
jgi:hypothetical protein